MDFKMSTSIKLSSKPESHIVHIEQEED